MKTFLILFGSLAWLHLSASTQMFSCSLEFAKDTARCNLANAVMPVAPTPLPSPPPGLVLRQVAIGRGVQNYTCAEASPDYKPISIGALAFLYGVSCTAVDYPVILSGLPSVALQLPFSHYPSDLLGPFDFERSGYHYFATNTTPVFNLNVSPDPAQRLGNIVAHKVANSTAPVNATKGEDGVGNGAVDWLYLNTTNATQGDVRAIYRLNTAGGNPPQTCESSKAVFSVQYAAEYWFYSIP